jgi:hypothetical protein
MSRMWKLNIRSERTLIRPDSVVNQIFQIIISSFALTIKLKSHFIMKPRLNLDFGLSYSSATVLAPHVIQLYLFINWRICLPEGMISNSRCSMFLQSRNTILLDPIFLLFQ